MKIIPQTKVPNLSVSTIDGREWELAQQSPEHFTLLLFYRGYH